MSNIDTAKALMQLLPGVEWIIQNDDFDTLEIIAPQGTKKPTLEELNTAIVALEAEQKIKKQTAETKLLALGLTAEDLQALGL
jgi:hypothetical protein